MTDAVRRGRPGYDQETVLRRAIDLFNRQGYDEALDALSSMVTAIAVTSWSLLRSVIVRAVRRR